MTKKQTQFILTHTQRKCVFFYYEFLKSNHRQFVFMANGLNEHDHKMKLIFEQSEFRHFLFHKRVESDLFSENTTSQDSLLNWSLITFGSVDDYYCVIALHLASIFVLGEHFLNNFFYGVNWRQNIQWIGVKSDFGMTLLQEMKLNPELDK